MKVNSLDILNFKKSAQRRGNGEGGEDNNSKNRSIMEMKVF
jgi:hypothetical protein